jgi:hypothetical protein
MAAFQKLNDAWTDRAGDPRLPGVVEAGAGYWPEITWLSKLYRYMLLRGCVDYRGGDVLGAQRL